MIRLLARLLGVRPRVRCMHAPVLMNGDVCCLQCSTVLLRGRP